MEKEIKFSEEIVVPKILAANPDLKSMRVVNSKAKTTNHVDGFMGTIVFLNILLETPANEYILSFNHLI